MQSSDDCEVTPSAPTEPHAASQDTEIQSTQVESSAAGEGTIAPVEDQLTAQIVKQVNFYFSDANLPTDAFLLKEVLKTPDGWGEPCTL